MRILVVKLSSLGDLFHALPAVHNLKVALNAAVDWVVQDEYVDLVRCFSDVERVIPYPRRSFFRGLNRFLAALREKEYDLVVDLQGLLKSALVVRLAHAKRRIGPSFHRECSGLFYSEVAGKRDANRHAVEQNFDVVRHLGLEVMTPQFPVGFPKEKIEQPHPRVAMLPSSRWKSKNWPVDSSIETAQALRKQLNATIFLVGGEDDTACGRIEQALPGAVRNMAGRTSLVQLGSLLQEMDLLISVDSGPMHMAAAVGTPVLAIFGSTDPMRTGPFGTRHQVLKGGLPCQPCLTRKCKYGDARCLRAVSPERVVETAVKML